ncbi:Adaptive-response sensory-kinase SasA [Paenibacillus solanacearum]|uniref:Adaptive-response sensory-kinase SasA n=1 Tax=Paenibacillus solanacearum TaxID=2048548 RepID=A0A916JUL7_9BACL|nr:ATP-binding protein [Paenibacillus solanacearum]CAG7600185.1 Adaptive-response sensory-kinase SasA [Paenibacillus solanacearum]
MRDNFPITRLTHFCKQGTGTHILYMYNEIDQYMANAVRFIIDGLVNREAVLFVDTEHRIAAMREELESRGFPLERYHNLIFTDSARAYYAGDRFDGGQAGKLIDLIQPFVEKNEKIRTWGQVLLPDRDVVLEQLRTFEYHSDHFIERTGTISVCAYNGLTTPAYIQNELLKSHNYFMTDTEFSASPLYSRDHLATFNGEELDRLRRLEQQMIELKDHNDRLTVENKLIAQNEQKVRIIIDQLPIPVIIRRKARILFQNGVAQRIFTINDEDAVEGNLLLPFFDAYDTDPAAVEDKKVHQHELSYKNGKKTHYLIQSIETMYEGEAAILHSFVDITHEKESEKLILRSEKLNIAGELAAGIAHELRNPLTAIKGFFRMLKTSNDKKQLYYSVIEEELSRIEQISSELLSLAKPHSESRSDHNLVQLIREVAILLTPQANWGNMQIEIQSDQEQLYVHCEDTKMKQVFINLIKNAMDAMSHGGTISIVIRQQPDGVQVQVTDEGSGIPPQLLNKIGEPFYTTKEKGTGLGLMVCFQIIESHAGTIHVDSKVGIGTTFTIILPHV